MAVLFCAWALLLGLLGQQLSVLCGQQSMCMVENLVAQAAVCLAIAYPACVLLSQSFAQRWVPTACGGRCAYVGL